MASESFIISMFCLFIWQTTQNQMIFEWFPGWIEKHKLLYKIRNPLYACPICSAPWYGTAIYWIAFHHSVIEWVLVVFAAGGINTVIIRMLHK